MLVAWERTMDRRKFIGLMGSGIAAGSAQAVLPQAEARPSSQGNPPNFLFIICDDLMYRTVHALNNPEVHTPALDRLAARGCAFTHCFHQGSWSGADGEGPVEIIKRVVTDV